MTRTSTHDTARQGAQAAFLPPAVVPTLTPLRTTAAVVAVLSLLSVVVGGGSPLLPLALAGILATGLGRDGRIALVLPVGVVVQAATAAVLVVALDAPVPTLTLGWTSAIAVLLLTLAAGLGHRGTSLTLTALAAGAVTAGVTAVAAGVTDAATVGIDVWATLAVLATAERGIALHLRRAGDPGPVTRVLLLGLLLTPAAADASLGVLTGTVSPVLLTTIATTLVWLVTVGVALRREARIARRATDLEALTSMFVEAEDRGVVAVGADGVIRSANNAANTMLAGPGGNVVGVSVDTFVPSGRVDRHRADRQRFRSGHSTRPMSGAGPVTARTLDGREVVLRIALRKVSGDDERIMGVIEDLSAERAEADALRTQLERQRGIVDQLRRLESLRTGLLTAASHELRTPVTVLHGTAELLAARHDQLNPATVAALLSRQLEQSRKLVRLLDDLVAMDPDSAPETHPRALPLDRAVKGIVERWSRRNDGQTVHVLAHPTTGWMDPSLLERVVEILLDNCRIHGASPIAIQVRSSDRGGLITVSDSGDGIPEHLLEEIFQPFGRGTSVDFANPGLGLGLPLARLLAEADGGTLVATPSSTGATLELRIPRPPLTEASAIGMDGSFTAAAPVTAGVGAGTPVAAGSGPAVAAPRTSSTADSPDA